MVPSNLPTSFRFVHWNVENLFLFLDLYNGQDLKNMTELEWQRLSSSTTPNKSIHKTRALAEAILDMDPDFLMLNEVGGEDSLLNFNRYFLQEKYQAHIVEGNSDRGIDVGYLTRRDLPFKYVLISHKNRPLDFLYPHEIPPAHITETRSHFFSRDVAELRVFMPEAHTPFLVILLTHLKSKLDPEGIDPEGKLRRQAELKTLVKIYNDVNQELEGKVPIMVAGDFNGEARRPNPEPEFAELYNSTDLMEVFELADLPPESRYTQIQFPRYGQPRGLHIDYIFISPHLHPLVVKEQTGPYLFKSDGRVQLPYPKTIDQRAAMPSDHHPVIATIKNWIPF